MGQVQILIAGVPASGKSSFGRWLADTKGFVHVDMGLGDSTQYRWGWNGLRNEWNAFCDGSDRDRLITQLKSQTASVVLNWGFPARMLPVVSALKASGVSLWWFDGDRAVARRRFKERARQQLAASESRFGHPVQGLIGRWAARRVKLYQAMKGFDGQYDGPTLRLMNSWVASSRQSSGSVTNCAGEKKTSQNRSWHHTSVIADQGIVALPNSDVR